MATCSSSLVATWDRCIGMAGDRGLAVAWEFAPDRAFNRPSDVQRVLDRLQQDRFGVLYDTANARAVAEEGRGQEGRPETLKGGQLELLARLSGRINHVHLLHADAACHAPGDELDEPGAVPPLGGGDGAVDFDSSCPPWPRRRSATTGGPSTSPPAPTPGGRPPAARRSSTR